MDMSDEEMVLYDYHGEVHYVSVETMLEWHRNPDEGPYRSEYKKLNPGQCTYIEHMNPSQEELREIFNDQNKEERS